MPTPQGRNGTRRAHAKLDSQVVDGSPVAPQTLAGSTPTTALERPRERTQSDFPPPMILGTKASFLYNLDAPNTVNFQALGRFLSCSGQHYRDPKSASGLLHVVQGTTTELRVIQKVEDLAALLADCVDITVVKDGKPKGHSIPTSELKLLLKSELFLRELRPLDRLIDAPIFLPVSFHLTEPGYFDGGPGQRVYYAGKPAWVSRETTTIDRLLDAMSFASNADRTNALASALTVVLRNHFPGQMPMFAITANRSHAGKGTIVKFATGATKSAIVHFEPTDWAFRRNLLVPIQSVPGLGVINIDNVHADTKGTPIGSSCLEAFVHDPRPLIGGPGCGPVRVIDNHFVLFTTGNGIKFSEDMLNRRVPIHLELIGDLSQRNSSISDPKNEFLPQNQDAIQAELLGMIMAWIEAGKPLWTSGSHSCGQWAKLIGGILEFAGYQDFLANQQERRSSDDPIAEALGLLGSAYPDRWLTPTDWAARIAVQGLAKTLISANDRDSQLGRARGTGKILSRNEGVTFMGATDDEVLTVRLRKARRRFEEGKPELRYQFEVLSRKPLPQTEE